MGPLGYVCIVMGHLGLFVLLWATRACMYCYGAIMAVCIAMGQLGPLCIAMGQLGLYVLLCGH